MAVLDSKVTTYIAQSQRALADLGYQIAIKENVGEFPVDIYKKVRFLSSAIKALGENNNLTGNEKQHIIDNMIKAGALQIYSGTPLPFKSVTVQVIPPTVINITNNTTASVTINNVVFIAKNGSDGTGVVQRLDKPFLTLAGARAAMLAFFTGGNAPSATNRVLMKDYVGYHNEKIVLDNFVDYDFGDSVIDLQSGANYVFDDNGVAVNSIIYGNATIKRSTAGTLGGVRLQNASSLVVINCNTLTSSRGHAISNAGHLTINATGTLDPTSTNANAGVSCTEASSNGLNASGGHTIINCGILSAGLEAVKSTGGLYWVDGNVYVFNLAPVPVSGVTSSGTGIIKGDIIVVALIGGKGVVVSGGTLSTYGSISHSVGEAINISAGTLSAYNGKIKTSGTNMSAIIKSGGVLELKGTTLIANGTGYAISAASPQDVLIYGGAIEGNKPLHPNINTLVGSYTQDSNVS